MLELLHTAHTEENEWDVFVVQFAVFHLLAQCLQHSHTVLLSLWHILFPAGILETHNHRGETRIFLVEDGFGKVFGARHVHGGTEAILQ